jgi:hypothetical protein
LHGSIRTALHVSGSVEFLGADGEKLDLSLMRMPRAWDVLSVLWAALTLWYIVSCAHALSLRLEPALGGITRIHLLGVAALVLRTLHILLERSYWHEAAETGVITLRMSRVRWVSEDLADMAGASLIVLVSFGVCVLAVDMAHRVRRVLAMSMLIYALLTIATGSCSKHSVCVSVVTGKYIVLSFLLVLSQLASRVTAMSVLMHVRAEAKWSDGLARLHHSLYHYDAYRTAYTHFLIIPPFVQGLTLVEGTWRDSWGTRFVFQLVSFALTARLVLILRPSATNRIFCVY